MEDQSLIRRNIVLELSAITTYEELAAKAADPRVKKLFLDISVEEKVHVGELQSLLSKLDEEFKRGLTAGKKEENAINTESAKKNYGSDQPVSEEAENDGEKGKNEKQKPKQTGVASYPADNGVFNLSAGDRIDLTFAPELFTKDEEGNDKLYKAIHFLNQLGSTSEVFKNYPGTLEQVVDYYDTCLTELFKRQLMEPNISPFYLQEISKRKKKPKLHLEPQDQQNPTGSSVAPNQDGATPMPVGSPGSEMAVGGG